MASAYQWINGVVVPVENFTKGSLEFITPKLERRQPFDALSAYMFYIVELEGEYRTQLIRMITNQPARLLVAFNMATHCGAANRDRQRVIHVKPLVDLITKDMTRRPECMVMLQQASDEDCFAEGGKIKFPFKKRKTECNLVSHTSIQKVVFSLLLPSGKSKYLIFLLFSSFFIIFFPNQLSRCISR